MKRRILWCVLFLVAFIVTVIGIVEISRKVLAQSTRPTSEQAKIAELEKTVSYFELRCVALERQLKDVERVMLPHARATVLLVHEIGHPPLQMRQEEKKWYKADWFIVLASFISISGIILYTTFKPRPG